MRNEEMKRIKKTIFSLSLSWSFTIHDHNHQEILFLCFWYFENGEDEGNERIVKNLYFILHTLSIFLVK